MCEAHRNGGRFPSGPLLRKDLASLQADQDRQDEQHAVRQAREQLQRALDERGNDDEPDDQALRPFLIFPDLVLIGLNLLMVRRPPRTAAVLSASLAIAALAGGHGDAEAAPDVSGLV